MILENYLNRSKHDVEKMDAPSCRTERSGERHLNTENYTIFKFFLSLNSKTFILKLFRYIVPIFFFFLSLGAMAQMDNNGNFHWDELYTPDEILELDMSLPNKVDVSAIKNRERVKYVKLRYNPWMASLPFDTTCFPNLESLSIETSLLIDLQGLEHFTQLKRLALIPDNTRWCRNVLQEQLPSVYSKVWNLTNLEELELSIAPVAIADFSPQATSIS